MEQAELCSQIEKLKEELKKLINLGASFNEIYKVSLKLDDLIVTFYRNVFRESV